MLRVRGAIDDETLTEEELRAIAEAKRELVRWRDQWVLVDERDIAAVAGIAGKTGTMPLARAAGAALAGEATVAGHAVDVVPEAARVARSTGSRTRAVPTEIGEPDGFVGQLRPYQARGVGWLSHLEASGFGGCLADDMGLGKTIMVIALALARPASDARGVPDVGDRQLGARDRALRAAASRRAHHGPDRPRTAEALGEALDAGRRSSSRATASSAATARCSSGIEWGRVVLDEAQNIKNPAAQQTRAA